MSKTNGLTTSEQNTPAPKRRGRGPDTKPRKRRTDNPASYLPHGTEAHKIARAQGKHTGRVAGSRNGWTKAEQAIEWELARAKARIEVAFMTATGEWATGEALQVLYRSIDPELWARWHRMQEHRSIRISYSGM